MVFPIQIKSGVVVKVGDLCMTVSYPRSRSSDLQSFRFVSFQNLSPPPFATAVGNWMLILKLQHKILIHYITEFGIILPVSVPHDFGLGRKFYVIFNNFPSDPNETCEWCTMEWSHHITLKVLNSLLFKNQAWGVDCQSCKGKGKGKR